MFDTFLVIRMKFYVDHDQVKTACRVLLSSFPAHDNDKTLLCPVHKFSFLWVIDLAFIGQSDSSRV